MRVLRLAAAAAVFFVMALDANAVERKGFIFGIGGGVGNIDCNDCDSLTGPAVEIHLGGMLNDKLAIVVDGSAVTKSESGATLYSIVTTGALQYWASDKVWLKGGVGLGRLRVESGGAAAESNNGLGFTAALGVEVLQKESFVLDIQGRYSTAKIEGLRVNNLSGVVGFNWY